MGCGWYRAAYYPAEALIDRRSVDDLADELVREFEDGVGETGIRPGIIGEIGTDKPWLSGPGGARPSGRRPGRAPDRAGDHDPRGACRRSASPSSGSSRRRAPTRPGSSIGHADSYPVLDHYLAIVGRGANVEFDFLGMSFTPIERHGEAPDRRTCSASSLARGHADRILLSQDVCHDSQLKRYGGNGYAYLDERFLPRLRDAGVVRGGDPDDDRRQPRPDPDPGRSGLTRPGRDAALGPTPSALERRLDRQCDVALERDARSGSRRWSPRRRPGSRRRRCPGPGRRRSARSTRPASRPRACRRSRRRVTAEALGGVPPRRGAPDSAISKQAAWAAARSSSGLVLPSDSSVRAAQLTGRSWKRAARTSRTSRSRCRSRGRLAQAASARRTGGHRVRTSSAQSLAERAATSGRWRWCAGDDLGHPAERTVGLERPPRNASMNPVAASGSNPVSHHRPRTRRVLALRSIRGSIRPTSRSPNRIGRT